MTFAPLIICILVVLAFAFAMYWAWLAGDWD